MTEKKRYKLSNISLNNPFAICDNGEVLTQNEIINKLNEQDESIKDLKETIIKITLVYHKKHNDTIVNLINNDGDTE